MTAAPTLPTASPPVSIFKRATKTQRPLRLAFVGYEGQGKTWSALAIAKRISEKIGKPIALADTEGGSSRIYADKFEFFVVEMTEHSPEEYVNVIEQAEKAGYGVLIIDSLSHEWIGAGGALEIVDGLKQGGGYGWDKISPRHRKVFEAMLRSRIHVIATMRQKKAYVEDTNARGRKTMKVVGTEPVQREGAEYEFDVIATITDAVMTITKSRVDTMPTGKAFVRPGADVADLLLEFLEKGEPLPPPAHPPMTQETRQRVDALRLSTSSQKDQKPLYDAAVGILRGAGFTSWSAFLEKGSEKTALAVEAALTPETAPETPETPAESSDGEVKQPQLVA